MIGILAAKGFEGPIHGPGHILHGIFVSQVGFVALFILAWLLSRSQRHHLVKIKAPTSIWACNCMDRDLKKLKVAWITAMALLLIPGSFPYAYISKNVPLKRDLHDFPSVLGGWVRQGIAKNGYWLTIPRFDDELVSRYRNSDGREVTLRIGYFKSQDQDRELVNDRLGWLYKNTSSTEMLVQPYSHIRVNLTNLNHTGQKTLALYWYDINGRIVTGNKQAKAVTILDGLIYNKTNGAIVILMTDVASNEDIQQAKNELAEFAGLIVPVLQQYLP